MKERFVKLQDEKYDMDKKNEELLFKLQGYEYRERNGSDVHRVKELEFENSEKEKELAELKEISGLVKSTMEENKTLKEKLKNIENEKEEIIEKFKATHRRLSRSVDNEVYLDNTVAQEMFMDMAAESPPFH